HAASGARAFESARMGIARAGGLDLRAISECRANEARADSFLDAQRVAARADGGARAPADRARGVWTGGRNFGDGHGDRTCGVRAERALERQRRRENIVAENVFTGGGDRAMNAASRKARVGSTKRRAADADAQQRREAPAEAAQPRAETPPAARKRRRRFVL